VLELDGLVLRAGAAAITHRLEAGAIHVVLGRNGAGKTRLARVLTGLEKPFSGRVLLDGVDVTGQRPGQRSVALVYQAFVNYPHWTVAQNIASPLVAAGQTPAAVRERVRRLAAQLGLGDFLDRLPEALSGGQQQRVAIGRALAKGARVLVMDEPLVNLDYKLRESLVLELRTVLHEAGVCVVYTSSDPRDAFALGDRVLLMAAHGLVQTGRPLDVYRFPTSAAAMELMSDPGANVIARENGLQMVRPEHLYLSPGPADAGGPPDLAFAARVLSRETNGSETYLHCEVSGNHWVAKLDGLAVAAPGAEIVLYASAESVREFGAPAVG